MFNYISVKEFAAKAGVSPQAVYQRIDKDLKQFVKIKSGKKTISEEALEQFSINENKLVDNLKKSDFSHNEVSDKLIQSLLSQLEKKDCQIAEKDRQIAEKDIQLKEITAALLNEQKSAQQAHALHAGTIKQAALLEAKNDQPDKKKHWTNFFKKKKYSKEEFIREE